MNNAGVDALLQAFALPSTMSSAPSSSSNNMAALLPLLLASRQQSIFPGTEPNLLALLMAANQPTPDADNSMMAALATHLVNTNGLQSSNNSHLKRPIAQHAGQAKRSRTSLASTPIQPLSPKSQTRRLTLQLDPAKVNTHATCRLCNNSIAATRLSNLTNHVRRHASMKQFQCSRCDYQHNEMAKVRLHMQHNHKDIDAQPLDNISSDMQRQWDELMLQCFPDCVRDQHANTAENGTRPAEPIPSTTVLTQITSTPAKTSSSSGVNPPKKHTCVDCGELVTPDCLRTHIQTTHTLTTHDSYEQYTCLICNFQCNEQMMILLHLTMQHERSDLSNVRSCRQPYDATITRYFPSAIKSAISDTKTSKSNMNGSLKSTAPLINEKAVLESSKPAAQTNGVDPVIQDVQCQLCNKVMRGQRSVSSLVSHAKRHYHIKQYACPVSECDYTSAESTHVRSHLKTKHRDLIGSGDLLPVDNKTAHLQSAWMSVTAKCFPSVHNLSKYRFKTSASPSGARDFEREQTPPAICGPASLSPISSNGTNNENKDAAQCCRLCNESIGNDDTSRQRHARMHADADFARRHLMDSEKNGEIFTQLKESNGANEESTNEFLQMCFGDHKQ